MNNIQTDLELEHLVEAYANGRHAVFVLVLEKRQALAAALNLSFKELAFMKGEYAFTSSDTFEEVDALFDQISKVHPDCCYALLLRSGKIVYANKGTYAPQKPKQQTLTEAVVKHDVLLEQMMKGLSNVIWHSKTNKDFVKIEEIVHSLNQLLRDYGQNEGINAVVRDLEYRVRTHSRIDILEHVTIPLNTVLNNYNRDYNRNVRV